ncbi:HAD family hydrolase [Sporolactobacillus shoreicorticis]|uniref:HAD family hydrolase n=1 Tax=Sporolactobacillus shoreicorticis TaxID=1923877 RepID=A0ABW5S174_9BACL|nr:HAD family hydrolase [Sporolactobacillus shoreicorticis]MCO7124715.1 HAD family hydrolase [Sporolactobacillus shoreicorticis]
MNQRYKLMCIDVDGTLVDSTKNLPDENKKAIQSAHRAGVKIAIASGGSPSAVREVFDSLDIDGYGICLNGAFVKDDDYEVSKYAFNEEQVTTIRALSEQFDVQTFFTTPLLNITNRAVGDSQMNTLQKSVVRQNGLIVCSDQYNLERELNTHIGSILKASIKEPNEDKYRKVRKALERTKLFDVAKSDTDFIDVNMRGVNKSVGVRDLANYLNIDSSAILCVGDNENDIEMIKAAGMGVAMANACAELLKVSDAVTLSNDECGVAKVIYDYILA